MIIANPIYDVVFKYLLEDLTIARELLSAILGETITRLQVKPQETVVKSETGEIKIFHLDFKATIRVDGKEKTVLIELQKAKKTHDLIRFRKYLGENYIKEEVRKNVDGETESYSLEIVTIYILGFKLKGVEVPVLKVGRTYTNAATQEEVVAINEFIQNLTHESFTIQVPRLKLNQQTQLEQVLEIFCQDNITDNLQAFSFDRTPTNPLVKKMVRRLSKAASSEPIRKRMDAEDMIDRLITRESSEKLRAQAAHYEDRILQQQDEHEAAIQKERAEKKAAIQKERKEKEAAIQKEREEKEAAIQEREALKKMIEDLQKLIAETKKSI